MVSIANRAARAGVCVLVLVVLLAGCPGSKRRQANQNLTDVIGRAQRLYDKAQAIYADPVYKIGGEYAPVPDAGQGDQPLSIGEPGEMNPHVLAALDQAQGELADALSANAEADSQTQSLALRVLGRIEALRADYRARQAAREYRQAQRDLHAARLPVVGIHSRAGLLNYYDSLINLDDSQIRQKTEEARKDASRIADEIAKIDKRTEELKKEIEALTAQRKKLQVEVEQARQKIQDLPATQGVDIMEQVRQQQDQIAHMGFESGKREDEIAKLKMERAELVLQAGAVKTQQAQGERLLSSGAQRKEQLRQQSAEVRKELDELVARLQASAAQAVAGYERGQDHAAAAAGGYTKAKEFLEKAQKLLDPSVAYEAELDLADVALSAGQLELHRVEALAAFLAFVQQVRATWETIPSAPALPSAIGELQTRAANIQSARQAGTKEFRDAAELYEAAMGKTDPKLRWQPQLQFAAALVGEYRISAGANETLYNRARQAVDEALANKRSSPFLMAGLQLERVLESSKP